MSRSTPRGRRRRIQLGPALWLTAVWVLLWGNLSWANVLGGFVVAVLVLVAFPLPRLATGVRVRPVALLTLLARLVADVVRASVHVSWIALRPGRVPRSSVVTTRLTSSSELVQMAVAQMLSLVPGSIVVALDPDTRRLSMHVFGAGSPTQVDRAHDDVLELERRVLHALGMAADEEVPT